MSGFDVFMGAVFALILAGVVSLAYSIGATHGMREVRDDHYFLTAEQFAAKHPPKEQ